MSTNETDILFDDFSILEKLLGQSELTFSSANGNCDCTNYSSTSYDDDYDTSKITRSSDKAN